MTDSDKSLPTVVYIEDDPPCADLVTTSLAEHCRILHASNGVDGLALVKRVLPSLVLVDLQLPDVPGFEVLDKLRANPDTADIPLLVISARIMSGEPARAKALGCRGFIKKPFRLEELRQTVSAALAGPP